MTLYHFIKSRTFYKVRSPHWLLMTFSICCYESFFTPCKLSSWHIQNMLFIMDPGSQLNKGTILMGHSFLFIFHFASICGEHIWCSISTKHRILNSYFRQHFKIVMIRSWYSYRYRFFLQTLLMYWYDDITKWITTWIYMHMWKVAKIMCWNGLHKRILKFYARQNVIKVYSIFSFPFPIENHRTASSSLQDK